MKSPRIAVVAFDRISPFHLSVPCLVFGTDRQAGSQRPWFQLQICAVEPGPLQTTAGYSIAGTHGLDTLADADVVIVPSWRDVNEPAPAVLLQALRAAHARGARIVGLCLGAYVLAAAGLLDGLRATTHWAWADDFRARYPNVDLDANVLYVEQSGLLTSAGVAAGIDCCLHLVREYYGHAVANQVARHLVVAPHREGMQAQFIEQPLPKRPADTQLAEVLDWLRAHLQLPHPIDEVANKLAMSRRTFTRRFRQLTGTTLGDWLLHERVAFAQRCLETTSQSIEGIAAKCGFGSSASLRQHFAQSLGTSPSAYRITFRGRAGNVYGGQSPADRSRSVLL